MPLTLNRTVAPTVEPVEISEAKEYARVLHSHEDGLIDGLIVEAREYVEDATRRQLINATWEWKLDEWPRVLCVPRPPLSSVTSIAYLDENGDSQTWASSKYQEDTDSEPGRIIPVEGEVYPSLQADTLNRITVTYVAGYGAAGANVPGWAKSAIMWLVNHSLVQRQPIIVGTIVAEMPETLKRVIWSNRVAMFA